MLTSSGVKRAFDLDRENPRLRDRYGRHMFGQSLLLARRLVQAGVPIVQANMGHMNNWDTHIDNCQQLRTRLLPPLDQGVSAFLDDLEAHGLLEETLVVMVGEFGRTPRIGQSSTNDASQRTGRDHWAGVFSAVFAGAGVRGGCVIGKSDKIAAYPATGDTTQPTSARRSITPSVPTPRARFATSSAAPSSSIAARSSPPCSTTRFPERHGRAAPGQSRHGAARSCSSSAARLQLPCSSKPQMTPHRHVRRCVVSRGFGSS